MVIQLSKPDLFYRLSIDRSKIYLRVPDNDTEKDTVLMFNRVMADYGFPEPKDIFSERIGVAVVPRKLKFRKDDKMITMDLFDELGQIFNLLPIVNRDWYSKRF